MFVFLCVCLLFCPSLCLYFSLTLSALVSQGSEQIQGGRQPAEWCSGHQGEDTWQGPSSCECICWYIAYSSFVVLCISCFGQLNDVLCRVGVIPLIWMGVDVLHCFTAWIISKWRLFLQSLVVKHEDKYSHLLRHTGHINSIVGIVGCIDFPSLRA